MPSNYLKRELTEEDDRVATIKFKKAQRDPVICDIHKESPHIVFEGDNGPF